MLRALAPYLLVAGLMCVGNIVTYRLGGPVWLFHVANAVAAFVVVVGYDRWEDLRQHPGA